MEDRKLQGIIDKYIHGNEKKAKIAKDRQKKLAKLEENAVVVEKKMKIANIYLHQGRESTKHPVMIKDLSFKYDKDSKRYILYKVNLDIPKGEKFLIVGENGVGKSTLLKLIVGELIPDTQPKKGYTVVHAVAPQAELSEYPIILRAMSQGRGSFDYNVTGYDTVPGNIAAKIVENYKKANA